MISCANCRESTLDTNFTRKVYGVSHLEERGPECYIIIRKGDTDVLRSKVPKRRRTDGTRQAYLEKSKQIPITYKVTCLKKKWDRSKFERTGNALRDGNA